MYDVEAADFDIAEATESRMRLQDEIVRQKQERELFEEVERSVRISHTQHSIAWLSTDERAQETAYEKTSKTLHHEACEWILNEPRWKAWVNDDSLSPCLWLSGMPGSGKLSMVAPGT